MDLSKNADKYIRKGRFFSTQLPRTHPPQFLNEERNPKTKTFTKYTLTGFIYSSLENYKL